MKFIKPIIKLAIAFVALTGCEYIEAKKLPGYIITENNDTINGEVRVNTFNRATGAFVFIGIDLEWCYLQASFREEGKFFFKYYTPKQIKGYSFRFKGQDYYFDSFLMQSNAIFKGDRNRYQFLNLVKRTPDASVYRAQRYNTSYAEVNSFAHFRLTTGITPYYSYYGHRNGDARVIIQNRQIIRNKSVIR